MQKVETVLNEKLLRLGNPKFWGKKFHIHLQGGSPIDGVLVRVNWTMRYGKVIGNMTIKTSASEKKIDLEDILDISQFTQTETIKTIIIPKEESKKEVKIFLPDRKIESAKIEKTAEVAI
jgi:hypothetical protein